MNGEVEEDKSPLNEGKAKEGDTEERGNGKGL